MTNKRVETHRSAWWPRGSLTRYHHDTSPTILASGVERTSLLQEVKNKKRKIYVQSPRLPALLFLCDTELDAFRSQGATRSIDGDEYRARVLIREKPSLRNEWGNVVGYKLQSSAAKPCANVARASLRLPPFRVLRKINQLIQYAS